jgi:hypothetical protein
MGSSDSTLVGSVPQPITNADQWQGRDYEAEERPKTWAEYLKRF